MRREEYTLLQESDGRPDDNRIAQACNSDIDMGIVLEHMVKQFGPDIAFRLAREIAAPIQQRSANGLVCLARYRQHKNKLVHRAQDLLQKRMASPVDSNLIETSLGISYRKLAVIFSAEAGICIKRFHIEARIDHARHLLIGTDLAVERVAEHCGFDSTRGFRMQWNKRESLSPALYRRKWR